MFSTTPPSSKAFPFRYEVLPRFPFAHFAPWRVGGYFIHKIKAACDFGDINSETAYDYELKKSGILKHEGFAKLL